MALSGRRSAGDMKGGRCGVAGSDRPTPGKFDSGTRRQCSACARPFSRYKASAVRRFAAGDAGWSRRRRDLWRSDECERFRRLCAPGRSTGSRCRFASNGRFSASASAPRCSPGNWARALRRHEQGRAEIGYYPIQPTAAGTGALPGLAGASLSLAPRGFELPCGAELLAEGGDFPVQAIQSGNAFGFQFHPDVTYAMMHRWTTRGG